MGQRSLFIVQSYLMYFHLDDDKQQLEKLGVETEWVD